MSALSMDIFKQMVEVMKDRTIKPNCIESIDELNKINDSDPTGHKWHLGDEYFIMYADNEVQTKRVR